MKGTGVRRFLGAAHRGLIRVVSLPIVFYRRFLSPLKGRGVCRFTPTCSEYALEALEEWGIVCGLGLTVWRVLRCNPFCRGGYDPVPLCPWRPSAETPDEAGEPHGDNEKNNDSKEKKL